MTVLPVLLAVSIASACGGDDSGEAAAPAAGPGGGDDAGSVTIEHRYGTTTFEDVPERIVSLDDQWTDVLVAMDGPLVAAAESTVVEDGRYPWQDVIPASVEAIPATDQIPYEAVVAAEPDLIVITYAATDQATYDRLNEIAPTIGPLGDAEVDRWQDIAHTAGEILGTPDAAEQLVTDAEQVSAQMRDELPGLDGRHYVMANYVPGDAIYIVADPNDGASELFAQLGLSIDPDILAIADGASGRAEVSLERVDLLDADLLIMLTNGADPADIPGYEQLPAVRSGGVAVLAVAEVSGLNTPSPLSIPYSLEAIRPALEAAANG
jgi:iron complex transport system substrate-binding protein